MSFVTICSHEAGIYRICRKLKKEAIVSINKNKKLICLLVISILRSVKNQFPNLVFRDNYVSEMFTSAADCVADSGCSIAVGELSAAGSCLRGCNFNDIAKPRATSNHRVLEKCQTKPSSDIRQWQLHKKLN